MAETNDYARQRLTHFLAARLKARECDANELRRGGPGSSSATADRPDDRSAQVDGHADSIPTITPPGEPPLQAMSWRREGLTVMELILAIASVAVALGLVFLDDGR
jgi:hypothetical protein